MDKFEQICNFMSENTYPNIITSLPPSPQIYTYHEYVGLVLASTLNIVGNIGWIRGNVW